MLVDYNFWHPFPNYQELFDFTAIPFKCTFHWDYINFTLVLNPHASYADLIEHLKRYFTLTKRMELAPFGRTDKYYRQKSKLWFYKYFFKMSNGSKLTLSTYPTIFMKNNDAQLRIHHPSPATIIMLYHLLSTFNNVIAASLSRTELTYDFHPQSPYEMNMWNTLFWTMCHKIYAQTYTPYRKDEDNSQYGGSQKSTSETVGYESYESSLTDYMKNVHGQETKPETFRFEFRDKRKRLERREIIHPTDLFKTTSHALNTIEFLSLNTKKIANSGLSKRTHQIFDEILRENLYMRGVEGCLRFGKNLKHCPRNCSRKGGCPLVHYSDGRQRFFLAIQNCQNAKILKDFKGTFFKNAHELDHVKQAMKTAFNQYVGPFQIEV